MPEPTDADTWLLDRLARLTAPWRTHSDIQGDIADIRGVVLEIITRIDRLEKFMADTSPILNQLAADLRAFATGPFAALVAENVSLRSERDTAREAAIAAGAEADALRAEDAAETSATDNAVSAFNELANPITESPEVPVEIPPVEVPTDPGTTPDDGSEPTPAA